MYQIGCQKYFFNLRAVIKQCFINIFYFPFSFSAIILRVSLGVRFLISEVVVDNAYRGCAKGLMGNFDGNATNEFILPNGILLDGNATKTERDIYFNFGQKCKKKISFLL